ncbi:MAG TPA: protein norD, partial [Thioalkalivibrio sp.]|nr:protein norD [Thioalkalivibrio sp.]
MFQFLEVEEFVGRYWHRWAARAASYPRYPEAAVSLDTLRPVLGVFFRASGGEAGLAVEAIAARGSGHRLSLRQRLGLDEESMDLARRDEENLLLPPQIALFPERPLNRDLYFWLTAFLALARRPEPQSDPLRQDIAWLREALRTQTAVLAQFPGLRERHARLSQALLAIRPRRRLPRAESMVEAVILALLGDAGPHTGEARALFDQLRAPGEIGLAAYRAPRDYRPPLPVPLWGQVTALGTGEARAPEDEGDDDGGSAQAVSGGKRQAQRRRQEQSERNDPLVFSRFEKLLTFSEMVNLNRLVEDEEDEAARRAADQLEEIVISPHQRRAATRLRVELDLAPDAVTGGRLEGRYR